LADGKVIISEQLIDQCIRADSSIGSVLIQEIVLSNFVKINSQNTSE